MTPLNSLISAYRSAFAKLPREVWLLAGGLLINRAGTMVLPFLSLYLTRDLGLTAAAAGFIIGSFGLGAMAGSFIGGWLSDRIDPLRVQQLSLVASGFGFLAFTRLERLVALTLGVFILATISEAFRPALMAAVARRSRPEVKARAFALIRLAANLGMSVGPAAAGLLAIHGYVWIFVGDALTCWAAALMLLLTLEADVLLTRVKPSIDVSRTTSPWRDRPFLMFISLLVLLAMTFFQVWSTMPLFLRSSFNMSERNIGLLLALNALIIVLTEMLLIRAVEHHDRMRVVGVGALLVCGGLALLALGSSPMIPILSMVVLTTGEMLSMPIMNAVVAERAGTAAVGRYMGAYALAFSTAFVVGPVAGTAVYQSFGPRTLWLGIGALGLMLAVGFASLSRTIRSHR